MTAMAVFQAATVIVGWFAMGVLLVWFTRAHVIRGDVLAEAEEIVDEHESIESFIADFIPDSRHVALLEAAILPKEWL